MSGELTTVRGGGIVHFDDDAGIKHAFRIAQAFVQAGHFQDTRSAEQAFVKMMAGHELGIGPVAAMTQIHTIDGKLSHGATLIAALIAKMGKYRYKVVESTDQVCRIEFFTRDGDEWWSNGIVTYTIEEAQRAGLAGKGNWKKNPVDMLWARCLSRGARRFCADAFSGQSFYTPEELGGEEVKVELTEAQVDEIIDVGLDDPVPVDRSSVDDALEAPPSDDDVPATMPDSILGHPGHAHVGAPAPTPVLQVPVTGRKGDQYVIAVWEDGTAECSCPAGQYGQECHHLRDVRRPFPDGTGYLYPGMPGYEDAPPDGQVEQVEQIIIDPDNPPVGDPLEELRQFAREQGLSDVRAMTVVASLGGTPSSAAQMKTARAAIVAAAREEGELG